MARYIDADNLLEKLSRMIDYCEKDRKVNALTALFQVGDVIMDCKTADVQEVRHGHWFILEYEYFTCSECGYYHPNGCDTTKEAKERLADGRYPKYCSECGAKMDGKE